MSVDLTESQAALARYYIAEAVRRRRLTGQPTRLAPIADLLAALSTPPDQTATGHQTPSSTEESNLDEVIGITEAAAIIGCTPRHCRRLVHDLDGHRIGTRSWAFHRDTVTTYAQEKHHGTA